MITEIALAKINLGLKVLGKRNDGYHEVDMIMQSISLSDQLTFEKSSSIELLMDSYQLLTDAQENLIIKAANLLKQHTSYPGGAKINLTKNIPIAAGLAGGSTDAAATLRGLNKLWQLGLTTSELQTLAAQIGSDVPFCIRGGTQRATGRGEILEPLPDTPKVPLVVFKPNFDVPTAKIYGKFCLANVARSVDIDDLIKSLPNPDAMVETWGNDLESVTLRLHPALANLKADLIIWGATGVIMSGSGPSIIAVTQTTDDANELAGLLEENYVGSCHVAHFEQRQFL